MKAFLVEGADGGHARPVCKQTMGRFYEFLFSTSISVVQIHTCFFVFFLFLQVLWLENSVAVGMGH